MPVRTAIKRGVYLDSLEVIELDAAAESVAGVREAACLMGTPRGKELLAASGLLVPEAATAGPDDLLIAVEGDDPEALERAIVLVEQHLAKTGRRTADTGWDRPPPPSTLASALRQAPTANLALVSVPGEYAAAEARKALDHGLHVHIFSDNVSLRDEVALKQLGRERGLLVMGPDCGTAIIGGVPLGFANVVARGPIGIVGASGSGVQQVAALVDRLGSGISHALGTGGRDLLDEVGGSMTLMALEALEADVDTRVILLLAKPGGAATQARVSSFARGRSKPVVACFLGPTAAAAGDNLRVADTLEEAAGQAVALAGGAAPASLRPSEDKLSRLVEDEVSRLRPGQRFVRGLFAGGTLADEAIRVLARALAPIHSNVSAPQARKLADLGHSQGHTILDLGDDAFTQGRPHPMLDPTTRSRRLVQEAADPSTAVLLCDVVLGHGAHPDPAGALAAAVRQARAAAQDRYLSVLVTLVGTRGDPQGLERQKQTLLDAGALVFASNACAAEVAGRIALRDASEAAPPAVDAGSAAAVPPAVSERRA